MTQERKARMIVHGITAAIAALVYYFLIEEATVTDIAIFVIGYIVLSFVLDYFRDRRKAKKANIVGTKADATMINNLLAAMGGAENVEMAEHEVNRVKIHLKDVDLLNQDMLNELALDGTGATLTGNQLQVIIGTHSDDVARQITEAASHN